MCESTFMQVLKETWSHKHVLKKFDRPIQQVEALGRILLLNLGVCM